MFLWCLELYRDRTERWTRGVIASNLDVEAPASRIALSS